MRERPLPKLRRPDVPANLQIALAVISERRFLDVRAAAAWLSADDATSPHEQMKNVLGNGWRVGWQAVDVGSVDWEDAGARDPWRCWCGMPSVNRRSQGSGSSSG